MTRSLLLFGLPVALIFLVSICLHAQSPGSLTGTVVDSDGAGIPRASVRFTSADSSSIQTETDAHGNFVLERSTPAVMGVLAVSANGFAPAEVRLPADGGEIRVVLTPAVISNTVTITGTETRLQATAASVVALSRPKLESTAAATLDDRMRQVPGFSLFRRAGGRTANPTTQGVSLRGVGASGASRAVVLVDGIPLNDPFGGWIYWGRVPAESVARVEVLRGPASDLYGSSAVGGVVSLLTRHADADPVLNVEASYGNEQTSMLSAFASAGVSKWRGSLAGEFFRTDGFIPVAEADRGPIDTLANVRRSAIDTFLERIFNGRSRVFGSAEFFQERRENGTPLQRNDTNLRNYSAGGDLGLRNVGLLTLRTYAGTQAYNQSFTAVAADRRSETLTRLQRVPSQVLGLSGQWTGNYRRNIFIAGIDLRQVRGRSDETGFAAERAVVLASAGGREFTTGVFGGTLVPIGPRLVLSGGVRFDRWENSVGYSATRSLSNGTAVVTRFPNRSESALSPRASVLFRVSDHISLTGTLAAAFRRPTLNELYRSFRVGDVLTLANENLRAERAVNGEVAAIVTGFSDRIYFRGGLYCTEISRAVSNVTLSATPALITRQRQNLGRTRACGIEADMQAKLTGELSLSGGYLFVDSRVVRFPVNTALENLRIPQIAKHQFALQAEYMNPQIVRVAIQTRSSSSQFDDDQNLFRLHGYFTFDALISRRLTRRLEFFAAVENLFDSNIEGGRTPVLTLASPRTARIGLRLRIAGK